jgi:hypothetical protein
VLAVIGLTSLGHVDGGNVTGNPVAEKRTFHDAVEYALSRADYNEDACATGG